MSLLTLLIMLGLSPTPAAAAEIGPLTVEFSTTTAPFIINAYAYKYGASSTEMLKTIQCENPSLDPGLQSYVPSQNGPNGREDSWGLSQINLYWNPDITKEQATDPFFSIEYMAKEFAAGHKSKWTCARKLGFT